MFSKREPDTEWQPNKISEIKRQLKQFTDRKIKKRARADARNNQPEDAPKNAPKYSSTEHNLFSLANGRFDELCNTYEASRENLIKSIENKYNIDVLAPEYKSDFIQNLHGEIDTAFTEEKVNLHTLAKNELQTKRDLKDFQAGNEVYHAPKSAKPISLILLILLAYLFGESIFNMFIFQDISELGLAGGFVLAAGCSAANIAMGFFCGHGMRSMVHISVVRKILGGLIFIPMVALAGIWNLFIAHFREVVIEHFNNIDSVSDLDISSPSFGVSGSETGEFSAAEAGEIAIKNILETHIAGISDITSYLLLFIGILVFIAVAWKIYNQFSDSYPNYSKMYDKTNHANKAWLHGQNKAIENIKNIVKNHKNRWDRRMNRDKKKIDNVQEAINTLVEHRSEIVANIENIKRFANHALQVYRERNEFLRGFRPAFFDNRIEFEAMKQKEDPKSSAKKLADSDFLPTIMAQDRLDKLKKNLDKNERIFASMTRQANEIQTSYLNGIQKKLDAIYAKETRSIQNIQQDAQQENATDSSVA